MPCGRLAAGALLATALATSMCAGTYWTASAMQSDLADRTRTTLEARRLTAIVLFSGRDAYVWAETAKTRADAVAVVRAIPGVRIVVVGEGAPPLTPGASVAAPSAPRASGTTAAPASTASAVPSASATSASSVIPGLVSTASPASSSTKAPVTVPVWPAIEFDSGSSGLASASKNQVAAIVQLMVTNPSVRVTLTGYSDISPAEADRQALGLARAKAVAAALTTGGVGSSRISVASRGANNPVASNDTSQGRALNRRVTVAMTQES